MGGNPRTKCILCGGSDFQQVFALKDESVFPQLERPGNKFDSWACAVLSCKRCGLAFRWDLSGRKIERQQDPGNHPLLAEDGICVNPLKVIPNCNVSPHTGLEELEEIGQFKNPPGAFLNIGNDGFDIVETSRLMGWHSSIFASNEEILSRRDNTPLEGAGQELQFDVVRLEGSLERAENPFTYLEQISGMLHKHGLLVVSMPDYSAWNFPIYGQGPSVEPDHLQRWFFTPQTLDQLLITDGYEVLRVSKFTTSYELPDEPDVFGKASELPASGGTDNDLILPPPQQVPCFRVFARRLEKRAAYPLSLRVRESMPADQTGVLESYW